MRGTGVILAATFGMLTAVAPLTAAAQDKVLKIGQLGVMSGSSASWGLVSRYSAEAIAGLINDEGGVKIGDETFKVEIVSADGKLDPRATIAGMERLAYEDEVKYVIGPNVDDPSVAVLPVVAEADVFNISYGFNREIFTSPSDNTALGMIASYQTAPVVYKYLKDNRGVETVSFVTWNSISGDVNVESGIEGAKKVGLEILSSDSRYEPGTTDFFPIMAGIVDENPDLIVLSGVAPADAPLLIRAARELGYEGIMSTETAQDAKVLEEVAGSMADGFISLGGANIPALASDFSAKFRERYTEIAGEWNDEASTKAYAPYMILKTLEYAGPDALNDIEVFKAAFETFETDNPFINDDSLPLKWVGESWFGHKRQISVPLVINEYRDGAFETLLVTSVE